MSAILVYNCPRCDSKNKTFDVLASIPLVRRYDWQQRHEVFCRCRSLKDPEARYLEKNKLPTIEGSLNEYFEFGALFASEMLALRLLPSSFPRQSRTRLPRARPR